MKSLPIAIAALLVACGIEAIPSGSIDRHDFDASELPIFSKVDCTSANIDALCLNAAVCKPLCLSATGYPDGSSELLLVNIIDPNKPTLHKGYLESNNSIMVAVILKDDDIPNDTIVFHDWHIHCGRYETQIKPKGDESPVTTCLNHPPHSDNDIVAGRDHRTTHRSLEQQMRSPRELNPRGYQLNVFVYYDDMFAKQFPNTAKTRIGAMMLIVEQMYSELKPYTDIKINVVDTVYLKGKTFEFREQVGKFAEESPLEANLWVFLTAVGYARVDGSAYLGSVCDISRERRVSVNKYVYRYSDSDVYIAEVIAHEIGHNLGIDHDCIDGDCLGEGPRKDWNEEFCYGYMDYNGKTQGWSKCSVEDFKDYINRQPEFCLPLIGEVPTDNETNKFCDVWYDCSYQGFRDCKTDKAGKRGSCPMQGSCLKTKEAYCGPSTKEYVIPDRNIRTFDKSAAKCRSIGLELIMPSNKLQSEKIAKFMIENKVEAAWFSKSINGTAGHKYADGSKVTYDGWSKNMPSNQKPTACGYIWANANHPSGGEGLWFDDGIGCDSLKITVCQSGDYWLAHPGKSCLGGAVLTTLSECKTSALDFIQSKFTKATFEGEVNIGFVPKGCYLRFSDSTVIFNKHATGQLDKDRRQVCHKDSAVAISDYVGNWKQEMRGSNGNVSCHIISDTKLKCTSVSVRGTYTSHYNVVGRNITFADSKYPLQGRLNTDGKITWYISEIIGIQVLSIWTKLT